MKSARTAKRSTASRKPSASTRRTAARPSPAAAPMGDEMSKGRHPGPDEMMGGHDELMDEDADLGLAGEEGGGDTDLDEDM